MSSTAYAWSLGSAMWRRSLNEIVRVRGALVPTTVAPMIFLLGTAGQFGGLADLSGFPTTSYLAWIVPLSCLQGGGFAGGAAGANLARDIESGWFDRLLTSPAPRPLLLAGPVVAAMTRAVVPTTVVLLTGLALGAGLSGGLPGLLALYLAATWLCAIAALWGSTLALRARSQQVGPLIQNGVFLAVFLSTAYTPQPLLHGWLADVARLNPVTYVLELARQATVSGLEPSWARHLARAARARRHDPALRRAGPPPARAHRAVARAQRPAASSHSRIDVWCARCSPVASSARSSPSSPKRSATTLCWWIVSRFSWRAETNVPSVEVAEALDDAADHLAHAVLDEARAAVRLLDDGALVGALHQLVDLRRHRVLDDRRAASARRSSVSQSSGQPMCSVPRPRWLCVATGTASKIRSICVVVEAVGLQALARACRRRAAARTGTRSCPGRRRRPAGACRARDATAVP